MDSGLDLSTDSGRIANFQRGFCADNRWSLRSKVEESDLNGVQHKLFLGEKVLVVLLLACIRRVIHKRGITGTFISTMAVVSHTRYEQGEKQRRCDGQNS